MSKLKKLGTLGTAGVLMAGGLILGSSPANAVTCSNSTVKPTNSLTGTTVAKPAKKTITTHLPRKPGPAWPRGPAGGG